MNETEMLNIAILCLQEIARSDHLDNRALMAKAKEALRKIDKLDEDVDQGRWF